MKQFIYVLLCGAVLSAFAADEYGAGGGGTFSGGVGIEVDPNSVLSNGTRDMSVSPADGWNIKSGAGTNTFGDVTESFPLQVFDSSGYWVKIGTAGIADNSVMEVAGSHPAYARIGHPDAAFYAESGGSATVRIMRDGEYGAEFSDTMGFNTYLNHLAAGGTNALFSTNTASGRYFNLMEYGGEMATFDDGVGLFTILDGTYGFKYDTYAGGATIEGGFADYVFGVSDSSYAATLADNTATAAGYFNDVNSGGSREVYILSSSDMGVRAVEGAVLEAVLVRNDYPYAGYFADSRVEVYLGDTTNALYATDSTIGSWILDGTYGFKTTGSSYVGETQVVSVIHPKATTDLYFRDSSLVDKMRLYDSGVDFYDDLYFVADGIGNNYGASQDVEVYFDGADWLFRSLNVTANDNVVFRNFDEVIVTGGAFRVYGKAYVETDATAGIEAVSWDVMHQQQVFPVTALSISSGTVTADTTGYAEKEVNVTEDITFTINTNGFTADDTVRFAVTFQMSNSAPWTVTGDTNNNTIIDAVTWATAAAGIGAGTNCLIVFEKPAGQVGRCYAY